MTQLLPQLGRLSHGKVKRRKRKKKSHYTDSIFKTCPFFFFLVATMDSPRSSIYGSLQRQFSPLPSTQRVLLHEVKRLNVSPEGYLTLCDKSGQRKNNLVAILTWFDTFHGTFEFIMNGFDCISTERNCVADNCSFCFPFSCVYQFLHFLVLTLSFDGPKKTNQRGSTLTRNKETMAHNPDTELARTSQSMTPELTSNDTKINLFWL